MNRNSGRVLLLALPLAGILAGVAIYNYGYVRVRTELSEMSEARLLKMKTLQKQISLISKKTMMEEEQLSLGEERKTEEAGFIQGTTVPLAGSTMQQFVKGVISSKGGTVLAENVGKPESTGFFTVLNETVDVTFPDIKTLVDVVCALETQTPYLVVKEIETSVKNPADPRELVARMKISGLSTGK